MDLGGDIHAMPLLLELTVLTTSSSHTAGGEGVACVERGKAREIAMPARKVKLVSTHGAGDEFIGALAASLAAGFDIEAALEKANDAAAILVSTSASDHG
jgi:ribokinase